MGSAGAGGLKVNRGRGEDELSEQTEPKETKEPKSGVSECRATTLLT
jgi:hypothetical protein